jgi:hypothetical protein
MHKIYVNYLDTILTIIICPTLINSNLIYSSDDPLSSFPQGGKAKLVLLPLWGKVGKGVNDNLVSVEILLVDECYNIFINYLNLIFLCNVYLR